MKIKNYIIGLLAGLLLSCSSGQDEEQIQDYDAIGINFTLSMNGVGATSRSLSPQAIDDYENGITPENIRVLAYATDGKVHEVSIMSVTLLPGTKKSYNIFGNLKGTYDINKVVILANCDSNFESQNSLSSLLYTYNYQHFNPEAINKTYIPMWGEQEIKKSLTPGSNTNLGTISLIRAMAKVTIKSVGAGGEQLTNVTLKGVNNEGICVPYTAPITGSGENLLAKAPSIPATATKTESVIFFKLSDKEAFAYLPEQSQDDKLQMTITLGGKDYVLPFKDYKQTEQPYYDVLRNTHYVYEVSVNFGFEVKYKVVEWDIPKDIEIGFD